MSVIESCPHKARRVQPRRISLAARPVVPQNSAMAADLTVVRETLRALFARDLASVDAQVAAYPDDESLWLRPPGISNPGGNLVLHIAGNLRHFLGATLGGTAYVRDRDGEFSKRGLTRDELRAEVRAAMADVDSALSGLGADQLESPYPLAIMERRLRTIDFLTHLAAHLTYHLGQLDYHRRLLTPDPKAVETVSVRAIPELSEK